MKPEVKALIDKAKTAIAEGKVDEAKTLTEQAKALQAVVVLEDEQPEVKGANIQRPNFGDSAPEGKPDVEKTAQQWAAKTLYVKKYGQPDAAFSQIADELYLKSGGYFYVHAQKARDFTRYVKSGRFDPAMERLVVLTPAQIAEAVLDGVSMGEIKSTLIEAQDTLSGYLVPEDYQQGEIISRLPSLTWFRQVANVRQTTRDVYSVATRTGGTSQYIGAVRVYAIDETPAGTGTNTNPTYGKISIPIHTLMADIVISKDTLEDSAVDLGEDVTMEFATARATYEQIQYLIGNGVGVPQGILRDGTTGGPSNTSITTLNSGGATSLSGDSFRNTPYQLDEQYRNNGSIWAMSKGTVRVTRTLKSGDGNYLWSDRNQQLLEGQPPKLEGYPVRESESLAAPTATNGTAYTANVYPVVFGDFKGYRIVDRIGMSITRYEDFTTAKQNVVGFVMRWRGGGAVTNPERFVVMKVAA